MKKKILSAVLASLMLVSCASFTAAADEIELYVEDDVIGGKGTEEKPYGSLAEAIAALNGADGTIYIIGTYDLADFNQSVPDWKGCVTIKGYTAESNLTCPNNLGVNFNGEVVFKDILFTIGEYAHINPAGYPMTFDGGEDSKLEYMVHAPVLGNATVDESYITVNSGYISTLYLAGGYSTSYANGVSGNMTAEINGGSVAIALRADAYMDDMVGISVGGNLSVIQNGGEIRKVYTDEAHQPEIMGALNFIFNNGTKIPDEFGYPEENVAEGVYIIHSAVGGKVMPTDDPGVFEIKAEKGKVAKINGEIVYDGTVTLEAGETVVDWEAGEQASESIEIKLTIGDANIITNGESKALDVPAQTIDNRTMVPLRAIFEALGAEIEWNGETRTVTSVKDDTTVSLTVGENVITVNGGAKELDVSAQIKDNRTLVPVRAISEAFGCDVAWDGETRTVTITK